MPSTPASRSPLHCHRVKAAKGGPPAIPAGIDSLWDLFSLSVDKYGGNNCLGQRTAEGFSWRTYSQVAEEVAALGAAFAARGLAPHGRVGIYGPNTPEWMLSMQACNRQGFYCVPLYDSLGESAVEYIIKHAEVSAVVVQGSKLPELLKALPAVRDLVHTVVYWGKADPEAVDGAKATGVSVYSYAEFVALGKTAPVEPGARAG